MEYLQKISRESFDEKYKDYFKDPAPLNHIEAFNLKEIVDEEKKVEFHLLFGILNGYIIGKGLEKYSATIINGISKKFKDKIPEKIVNTPEEMTSELIINFSKTVRAYYDRYLEFGRDYIEQYKPQKTKA